jgi:hypothetical protein
MTQLKLIQDDIDRIGNGAVVIRSGGTMIGMVPTMVRIDDQIAWEISLMTNEDAGGTKSDFVSDHNEVSITASQTVRKSKKSAWLAAYKLLYELAQLAAEQANGPEPKDDDE